MKCSLYALRCICPQVLSLPLPAQPQLLTQQGLAKTIMRIRKNGVGGWKGEEPSGEDWGSTAPFELLSGKQEERKLGYAGRLYPPPSCRGFVVVKSGSQCCRSQGSLVKLLVKCWCKLGHSTCHSPGAVPDEGYKIPWASVRDPSGFRGSWSSLNWFAPSLIWHGAFTMKFYHRLCITSHLLYHRLNSFYLWLFAASTS